jgi:hypothetical protein
MALTATAPALDIGRVLATSLGLIRRRWPAMLVFLLIFWALQVGYSFARTARPASVSVDLRTLSWDVGLSLAWALIEWLRDSAIVAASVVPSPRPPIAAAAVAALRSFPALLPYRLLVFAPVLAVQLGQRWWLKGHMLQAAAIVSGLALAVLVLRLAAAAVWGLIVPVAVAERCGPLAAMGRSAALLAGNRWRWVALEFGVTVASGLPAFVATLLISFLIHGRGTGAYFRYEAWIASVLASLIAVFWMTMTAAAYQQLIHTRKGLPAGGDIADIFG